MASAHLTFETAHSLVGRAVAVSDWMTIGQDRVDHFAAASDDCGWMHTDPVRARQESPFGGTIVHGFLSLSLISILSRSIGFWPPDSVYEVNYGVNNVRFTAPIPVGARVRGRFSLKDVQERDDGGHLFTTDIVIEVKNAERPAMYAQWLTLLYPPPANRQAGSA